MTTVERFKAFWAKQTSPLHPSDTPEFRRMYASELRILFDDASPKRVLEIGCGNGTLFEFLGFNCLQYKGVDFSPSLLEGFKSRYPGVNLELREGSSYVDKDNKYDLIFSNEVIHNFDMPMLDRHFACARAMMHEKSLFICASIPWKALRSKYYSGALTGRMVPSILRSTKSRISRILFGDRMGFWYDHSYIMELSEKHGFSVKFYGSMTFLYRFHAVMKSK